MRGGVIFFLSFIGIWIATSFWFAVGSIAFMAMGYEIAEHTRGNDND